MGSLYDPKFMVVKEIRDEAPNVRSMKLVFRDEADREGFSFRPGQFGQFSVFGAGECPISISSPPTRGEFIECCFRKVGKVTSALADRNPGDMIGFRGPYGNGWPLEEAEGRDIVFVGGGIALPPLRTAILTCLDMREKFGDLTLIYGARSAGDLVYKDDLRAWGDSDSLRLVKTVDPGGEVPGWDGEVGLVPTVLGEVAPDSRNALAFVCGPPIMIKFTLPVLNRIGFPDDRIYVSLENKMKCGIGKCGRCNIGKLYVCKDGPVFSAAQLRDLPDEY